MAATRTCSSPWPNSWRTKASLHEARNSHGSRGVRCLERCPRLAPTIDDWGKAGPHNRWVVNLLWCFSHREAFFNKVNIDRRLPEP